MPYSRDDAPSCVNGTPYIESAIAGVWIVRDTRSTLWDLTEVDALSNEPRVHRFLSFISRERETRLAQHHGIAPDRDLVAGIELLSKAACVNGALFDCPKALSGVQVRANRYCQGYSLG